jgi:type II secretory pathway pseudopilin PulG
MFSKQAKSKGLTITMGVILKSLFAIAIIGLLLWLLMSMVLRMHEAINENTNERNAINLANVLISSDKLAYEKGGTCIGVPYSCDHYTDTSSCVNANCGWVPQDQSCYGTPKDCGSYKESTSCTDAGCTSVKESDGKLMRGVLDAEKLDETFVRSGSLNLVSIKDIGIGYPNSFTLVRIVDLEKCDSSDVCDGWIGYLTGPMTLQGLSVIDFGNCVSEHAQTNLESLFKNPLSAPSAALGELLDVKDCAQNNIPSSFSSIFSDSKITSEGFPIVIKYPNGDLHLGRIYVLLGEFT